MTIQKPRPASTDAMIRALVDDKFTAYLENDRWENENTTLGPSPNDRLVEKFRSYDAEMCTAMQRYKLHLKNLSRAEVEEEVDKREAELAERSPGDERLFFNEPFAHADNDHRATKDTWSLEEAAALLLGKDPDVVKTDSLSRFLESSVFVAKFVKLLYGLQEAKERGELDE